MKEVKKMKKNTIISALFLLTTSMIATDSIYDGTGSLIHSSQQCWGCDRDETVMHPHKNKNSTVTFQVLYNAVNCDHVDIHANTDLGQDVNINLKSWDDTNVKESYQTRLPVKPWNSKDGISLQISDNSWTTIAISSTKPISNKTRIYAYCRNSIDPLNQVGLETVSTQMTQLDKGYFHLGNGSLITSATRTGYGVQYDAAVSSKTHNAETSFQVLTNKDTCSEVTVTGTSSKIEEILVKGWSEDTWKTTNCDKLPCTISSYLSNNNGAYMLFNIKTKANSSNSILKATCGKENVEFNLNEKVSVPKHPNNCKFNDVVKSDYNEYNYVTALCSAGIVEGYGHTSYTEFGPNNPTLWSELTKVVNLADNFYKTKKIRDSYSGGDWFDAYVDIAKNQGFDHTNNPQFEVERGLAYRYIVKVFWNEDMTEEEAASFLSQKGISYRSNISKNLSRGYMAEIILKSAKISADESSIERKIPYINHDIQDLDIKSKEDLPDPTFTTPLSTDSEFKRKETVQENIDKATQENNVVSEKGYTDNTGLTVNILGGETNLQESFQEKGTAEEIIDAAKSEGITTPVTSDSKIQKNSIVEIINTNTGETIIAPTKEEEDAEGNAKISMEVSPGEVKTVDKNTLEENGLKVESQVEIQNIMKQKGE